MKHLCALALVFSSSPCGLLAQAAYVSPVANATTEGNNSYTYPFSLSQCRYQQIHGDLRGTPMLQKKLVFRRDGASTQTTGLPRTLDMELVVCDSKFAAVGLSFAGNYSGTPVTAIARKSVNTPNWQTPPVSPPAPFDFALTYDQPWLYTGLADFLWEVKIWTSTGSATDYLRADRADPATLSATPTVLGQGCLTNASTTSRMNFKGSLLASTNGDLALLFTGAAAPANSPAVTLLIGASNPNLTIPNLCATIYTSAEIALAMPAADATGSWNAPRFWVPYNAGLSGVQIYTQVFAPDASYPVIPVAGSNGVQFGLPGVPSGPAALVRRTYDITLATAPLGQGPFDGGNVVQIGT